MENINPCVLVVTHKPEVMIESKYFRPISVNRGIDRPDWLSDNTGQHISYLNDIFCELTALYWAWKNLPEEYTHVGLFHYRRALMLKGANLWWVIKRRVKSVSDKHNVEKYIDDESLVAGLRKFEVLLPHFSEISGMSVSQHYKCRHVPEDWEVMMSVLRAHISSEEYESARRFFGGRKVIWGNIFIARRDFFESYCSWVFPILFDVFSNIRISQYPYQRRVVGFLAERLMSFYISNLIEKGMKIGFYPALHWM